MRVINTVTRFAAALWIAILLNGALVAAFDHAATRAWADSSASHPVRLA